MRKLKLRHETVRQLTGIQLQTVAGGLTTFTTHGKECTYNECPSFWCPIR